MFVILVISEHLQVVSPFAGNPSNCLKTGLIGKTLQFSKNSQICNFYILGYNWQAKDVQKPLKLPALRER
jgi:hypothetical protein